ncbi:MAG: type II methionyl aminopeptidase [Candidatus Micrarchaeota archaeon]|nr:type II methionyl aminopeptidase [Candidatus Micrarchaeota archaeon]MDE1823692.1 type II methionyl aminopeptidase [Candidatus Micrarchaeota archaeon]MDE1849166.1 type II methionyl aminopeptidase [Candidatus Micrarchaeota archaeon]
MEDDYDYDKLREAGKISSEALVHARKIVKEGAKLLDVAEGIEKLIKDGGCLMSFPVNISVNEQAAHYTPSYDDKTVFGPKDIVKVDIGARKGDYLTDCAITIDLSGNNGKLVEASEKALETAISMVKDGVKVNSIGAAIEKIAKEYGFNPIKNLGGHGVEREELHASVFVPNYDNGDESVLNEGEVIAIEPFMTTGEGFVEDGEFLEIFQKTKDIAARAAETRKVMEHISNNYKTFPFALRWLRNEMKDTSEFGIRRGIAEMLNMEALEAFPVLIERSKGMVAQAEKEVVVGKDSCEIITK